MALTSSEPSSSPARRPTLPDLIELTDRFAALADEIDQGRSLASCPGWTVSDLIRHLSEVHGWATDSLKSTHEPATRRHPKRTGLNLVTSYRVAAHQLIETLTDLPSHSPSWVFAPTAGPGTSSFWLRRQVHETCIHLWDLSTTVHAPQEVDPSLAWDGVEEVAEVFYPRQVALARTVPLAAALHLQAADLDDATVVVGSGAPVVARLPAFEMLLGLWHRTDPVDLSPAARRLIAQALTP